MNLLLHSEFVPLFMNDMFSSEIGYAVLGAFLGIGLAAAAGFRVFVPLFLMSLTVHFGEGIIPLSDSWQWVGDWPALITLGVATMIEVFAYFIPFVDNLLDSIAIPLATVAGTFLMASQLTGLDYPVISWALAIIAGGGTAAAIKSASAGTRGVSSATTGGTANFAVASAETGLSTILSMVAIFLPILAVVLVFFILFYIFRYGRRLIKGIYPKSSE